MTTTPNAIGMRAQGGTATVEAFHPDLGAYRVEVLEAAQPSGGDRAPLPEG